MEARWRLPGLLLLLLCLPPRAPAQGDFDLADALDDPEPTKKPSSDIYPKPPYGPQPGNPDSGDNIYPRPKPQPRPQPGNSGNSGGYYNDGDDGRHPPKPRPPAGGGGGGGYGGGGYDSYGHSDGRGRYRPRPPHGDSYGTDGQSTYGHAQDNTVARIVSPIVSVVVVALVGAGVSYFKSNRRRNCFRASDPETV